MLDLARNYAISKRTQIHVKHKLNMVKQIIHCSLRLLSTITALLSVLAICGCAAFHTVEAYPGGAKSSEEVALIKESGFNPHITIFWVDVNWDPYIDFRVEGAQRYHVMGVGTRVKVPPGKHKIQLEYTRGWNFRKEGFVTFIAEAGKTYIAKGEEIDGFVLFWIEDADTGVVVGGWEH
jgi:hypothetical protein